MSLCQLKDSESISVNQKSLPETGIESCTQNNGTPLLICRGSYTLEAAVVVPLAAVFLMTILFLFRVLQVQTELQQSISLAGRRGAVAGKELSLGVAEASFRLSLLDAENVNAYVKNGTLGVSTLGSEVDGEYLKLRAACRIKIPVNLFGLKDIRLLVGSRNRIWSGHTEGEQEEAIVYYTPTGTVYHVTKSCPYLDLSIHSADFDELGGLRNLEGHRYYPCRDCVRGELSSEEVFITDYGTAYHARLSCSGLKRTILEIPLSEVGNRPPCSKCSR